jgi:hypothetical protein
VRDSFAHEIADCRWADADWTAKKVRARRWFDSIGIRQFQIGNKEVHLEDGVKIVNGFSPPTAS